MLKLTGYTEKMEKLILPLPLSFEFKSNLDAPADRLDLTFLYGEVTRRRFSELTAENEQGECVFDGIVDEQVTQEGGEGTRVSLKCRGRAALLVDNEAMPRTYYQLGQPDLYLKHIAPYGFTALKSRSSPVLSNFVVPKGFSHWDVVASFCLKAFGRVPCASPEGVVYTYYDFREKRHIVSNGRKDALHYLRAVTRFNRYAALSRVYLRDGEGNYSSYVDNDEAFGRNLSRVRYLIPPSEMAEFPITSATQKIKSSMLGFFTIELTLPGLADIQKGDRVTFEREGERYEDFLAGDVYLTYNPDSPLTVVTLYDPQYL